MHRKEKMRIALFCSAQRLLLSTNFLRNNKCYSNSNKAISLKIEKKFKIFERFILNDCSIIYAVIVRLNMFKQLSFSLR